MNRIRSFLVFIFACSAFLLSAEDPRPRILLLGESSSLPIRGALPWTGVLERTHPEWRLTNLSVWDSLAGTDVETPHKKKTKTFPGWAAGLDVQLQATDGAELVIVMLGINHSRKEIYEKLPPEQAAEGLRALLQAGKQHAKTKDATWVVVTPLPIVPAKLDKWSQNSFSESVPVNQQLAKAWREVAKAEGAEVIDAHSWILQQGKQGDAIMNAGWMVRWNGIDKLGAWMTEQIEALSPQPRDAKAFSAWKEVQAAHASLDQILEASGGGRPATTQMLSRVPAPEGDKPKKAPPVRFEVPLDQLAHGSLSVLVESSGPHLSTLGTGSDSYARPYLEIQRASGKNTKLQHVGTDWQYITELQQDSPLPDRRFGVNIGKWRPMILLDGREGQQRMALMRWKFPLMGDDPAKRILLVVPNNDRRGYFKEEFGGKANELKSPGSYGDFQFKLLARPDANWDSSVATWKSRDGKNPWTGGEVDSAKRKQDIQAFLQSNPPAEVKARAEALLN